MIIPPNDLHDDTLYEVAKDHLLRGVDGDSVEDLNAATKKLVAMIKQGTMLLLYSELTETVGVISEEEFKKNQAS